MLLNLNSDFAANALLWHRVTLSFVLLTLTDILQCLESAKGGGAQLATNDCASGGH